jgi:hypothetical protein
MGLGWQSLSSSGSVPFWQSLYQANSLDEPLMSFYLTRFGNQTNAQDLEPGGVFTLGMSIVAHPQTINPLTVYFDRCDQLVPLYGRD